MKKVFKFLSVVVFLLSLALISSLDNKSDKVEEKVVNILVGDSLSLSQ